MKNKTKFVMEEWHNSDLIITKYGLEQMRTLIIIGAFLGFILGILVGGIA